MLDIGSTIKITDGLLLINLICLPPICSGRQFAIGYLLKCLLLGNISVNCKYLAFFNATPESSLVNHSGDAFCCSHGEIVACLLVDSFSLFKCPSELYLDTLHWHYTASVPCPSIHFGGISSVAKFISHFCHHSLA